MVSTRRTRRRREQRSFRCHQLRLEGLEKRYALDAAPVLDPTASPQLNSVIEDAGIPVGQVGTLVSSLIDDGGVLNNFSDIDGDLPGIAITGTNLQGGSLYYSTDDGATWLDVGTVSETSARVLYADPSTRLYFNPAEDFFGDVSNVITFKAWDRNGGYINGEAGVPIRIPSLTGSLDFMFSQDVTLSSDGNTAYVADGPNGLQIIDVSNPSAPARIGTFNTSDSAMGVTLSPDGNTAYVADSYAGLKIIDVSNPSAPARIDTFDASVRSRGVTLSPDGNTAYIADWGLQIIDVSNPSEPTLLGKRNISQKAHSVTLSPDGNTAYMAVDRGGLQIIDVSNPSDPTLTGGFNTSGIAFDVTLSSDGNTAYIADHNFGLRFIDVSNPSAPAGIGIFNTSGSARGVTLSPDGNTAYVADSYAGLKIIDVSNPSAPARIDTFDASTDVGYQGIALSSDGNTAYIAEESSSGEGGGEMLSGGLRIIDLVEELSRDTDTVSLTVEPINDAPTLDPISNLVLPEDSLAQLIRLGGASAGAGETEPLRITATSSDTSLVIHPSVNSIAELDAGERLVVVTPLPDQYGIVTITVTVEDGGLDLDLDTADDNATFSRTFDVTITPDTDNPPSPVTPHGKMFIHETLPGDPLVSYQLPAVNVNGEAINGLFNRITATSSDTALIPDPTVIYASVDVPSSLSFSPVADANGSAMLSIQVEDGGPDNDFATTEDNRQATHQVEVNILEVISNQGSATLAKDSSENLYANTQPVTYQEQQSQTNIAGFAAIGATSEDGENALLVQRSSVTNRLVTDDAWRINGLFDSLQNESSTVLDLTAREVSSALNVAAVSGAYEVNGVNNPTLIVRRGQTYTLNLNVAGHPFYLQTTGSGYQSANAYSGGFTGNGQTSGEHQWVVPEDAPDEIYYQCEFHPVMFGKIVVID